MLASSKHPKRKMHPNSLKNLEKGKKPWLPGESGNPGGYSVTSRQGDMMREVSPFDKEGRIWGETLAEAGLHQALYKPEAMKNLLDRQEGKVPDKTAIIGEIRFVIKYDNEGSSRTSEEL